MAYWNKKLLKEEHFEKDVLPNFQITPIKQDLKDGELEKYYSIYIKDTLLKALGIIPNEYEKYLIDQRKEFIKSETLPN